MPAGIPSLVMIYEKTQRLGCYLTSWPSDIVDWMLYVYSGLHVILDQWFTDEAKLGGQSYWPVVNDLAGTCPLQV